MAAGSMHHFEDASRFHFRNWTLLTKHTTPAHIYAWVRVELAEQASYGFSIREIAGTTEMPTMEVYER
jgi:hypothetical protein